jgi:hypothetical protein
MESVYYLYLLVFLVIVLLVYFIWNYFTKASKIKSLTEKKEEMSDGHYWELKFKTQYMISMFSVLVAFVVFLGYNSIEGIKKDADKYVFNSDSSLKTLSKKINEMHSMISKIKDSTQLVDKNLKSYHIKTGEINNQLYSIKTIIDTLNSKNLVKLGFYVIDSLFQLLNAETSKIYYYSDLKTSIGDKLPVFTKTPVVVPLTRSFCNIEIEAKNNNYFEASYGSCSGNGNLDVSDFDKPIKLYFSVLIIETP